jgi:hypothetical protein
MMVKTLADVKASMPPKQRGVIKKEYGVNLEVNKVMGALHYTAGRGGLKPDFRCILKGEGVVVRSYKPGDWEPALKKAYDDLVAQSGAFAGLSVRLPEPISDIGEEAHPPRDAQPQKKKGVFDRLLGMFTVSED